MENVEGNLEGSRQFDDAEAIEPEEPLDNELLCFVKKEKDEGRDEGSFQLLEAEEADSEVREDAFKDEASDRFAVICT